MKAAGVIVLLILIGAGLAWMTHSSGSTGTTDVGDKNAKEGDIITTKTGLKYVEVKIGDGKTAQAGDLVEVHYTGRLKDGTQFDSSVGKKPFVFPLGKGRVIKGWDEGVAGMKEGGKRKLIVPPELGYGPEGTPGGPIPPNAELVFDVELLKVK